MLNNFLLIVSKLLGVIYLLSLVSACGESGSDLPGAPPVTGLTATPNPSVRVLSNNANIVISFSKTMDIGNLNLSGTMLNDNTYSVMWADNRKPKDTLVLSPTGGWKLEKNRSLNIIANELSGAEDQISLSLIYDVYAGTGYFVSNDNGDDTLNGLTPATATKTISSAIEFASANTPAWIAVDAGNYPVTFGATGAAQHVILTEGISLYGGYNAEFTDRDTEIYTSIISNDSTQLAVDRTNANTAIEIGNGVTSITIVDGFTINASTQPDIDRSSAIWVRDGGSPTIQNNILNAGVATFPFGILNATNASPVIQYNVINGGTAVITGSFTRANSYGIYNLSNSNPVIRYNTISGGSAVSWSIGIFTDTSSTALIYNNVINAGDGEYSNGVGAGSSSPVIQNNTINGGNGTTIAAGVLFYSVDVAAPLPSPTIENNIIFTSGSGSAYCLYEWFGSARPASVRNNNLFSCATAIYYDPTGTCTGDGDGDLNSTTCTLAEMQAFLDVTASGNTTIDMTTLFIDFDGPDDNILTTNDNNWHLSSSTPISIKAGGLNGIDDVGLGWGYIDDMVGIIRPASGAPWSMGAYEPY